MTEYMTREELEIFDRGGPEVPRVTYEQYLTFERNFAARKRLADLGFPLTLPPTVAVVKK